MLAKALAKESGATFINIAASVLTNKWYGESNKLVAALFSLARKTQPSIVFIDEIDSFLRERTKGDHEVTGMMKAEFMTCVNIRYMIMTRSFGSWALQAMGWPALQYGSYFGAWCYEPAQRHRLRNSTTYAETLLHRPTRSRTTRENTYACTSCIPLPDLRLLTHTCTCRCSKTRN